MSALPKKAMAAAATARQVVGEDPDTAVGRAYYAMFDVARMLLRDRDPELAAAKTHATIIRRLSLLIVENHGLSAELGRTLNRAGDYRRIADYGDVSVTPADAQAVIAAMDQFFAAILPLLGDEAARGGEA